MNAERNRAQRARHSLLPHDISDEVFDALIALTDLRVQGKTLADLTTDEADRLARVLGEDEVEDILSIDDTGLLVPEFPARGIAARLG